MGYAQLTSWGCFNGDVLSSIFSCVCGMKEFNKAKVFKHLEVLMILKKRSIII